MSTKTVSQLDDDGFFVGVSVADESPLEPGVFHLPRNSVDIPPPELQSWQKARYVAGSWIIVEPEPDVEEEPEDQEVEETYKEKRLREYPPFTEYLDGITKGDAAQVQRYIDACLAVKAKYPKPM